MTLGKSYCRVLGGRRKEGKVDPHYVLAPAITSPILTSILDIFSHFQTYSATFQPFPDIFSHLSDIFSHTFSTFSATFHREERAIEPNPVRSPGARISPSVNCQVRNFTSSQLPGAKISLQVNCQVREFRFKSTARCFLPHVNWREHFTPSHLADAIISPIFSTTLDTFSHFLDIYSLIPTSILDFLATFSPLARDPEHSTFSGDSLPHFTGVLCS